jgi:hypothetical protein
LSLIVTSFGLLHELPLRPPFRRDGYVIRLTRPYHESAVLQRQFLLKLPQAKQPLLMKSFDLSDGHGRKCSGIFWRLAGARIFHALDFAGAAALDLRSGSLRPFLNTMRPQPNPGPGAPILVERIIRKLGYGLNIPVLSTTQRNRLHLPDRYLPPAEKTAPADLRKPAVVARMLRR